MSSAAKKPLKYRMSCSKCGSDSVLRDAWAAWNEDSQEWELSQVFDNAYCEDCDGETSIVMGPIEP